MISSLFRSPLRGGPIELLAFLPALSLGGFWLGGEGALVLIALGLPVVIGFARRAAEPARKTGPTAQRLIDTMDAALRRGDRSARSTGCFVIQFDNPQRLLDRHGRTSQSESLARCADRVGGVLRQGDCMSLLEDGSLVVVLGAADRLDLETMIQIAGRIQTVAHQPLDVAGGAVQLTCSIGFCNAEHAPELAGRSILDAAQVAADEARRHGPGAIRSFTADMARAKADRAALRDGMEAALRDGQIKAHFQPQLCTDTGAVSGMEALARWHHPERGFLMPAEFLPAIKDTTLGVQLSQAMITQALTAIAAWDRAGHFVPTVSVNFSTLELCDPDLPARLSWELDRFGLAPVRLTVEVLESVVAPPDCGVIAENLSAIAAMGCGIDLDDFGTGNASITTIRRFALRRLKIDRSFVTGVDIDRDQQKLVAAILSLAERLGLKTLGEGVENVGEHAMMAQLGCNDVQGYAIARPMPAEEVPAWMALHTERQVMAPRIGQAAE